MAIGKAGGFHRISFKSNNLEILLLTQVKGRGYYHIRIHGKVIFYPISYVDRTFIAILFAYIIITIILVCKEIKSSELVEYLTALKFDKLAFIINIISFFPLLTILIFIKDPLIITKNTYSFESLCYALSPILYIFYLYSFLSLIFPIKNFSTLVIRNKLLAGLIFLMTIVARAQEFIEPMVEIWSNMLLRATIILASYISHVFGINAEILPNTPDGVPVFGTMQFHVAIMSGCTGYEGMTLVAMLLALYCLMERKLLAFPQSLLIFPFAILSMFILNAFRIAILIAIGHFWSADIALNGFHSVGGWINLLIVLTLSLLAINQVSFFSKKTLSSAGEKSKHFKQLGDTIYLFPLMILLISTLFIKGITGDFQWLYPIPIAITAASIAYFRNIFFFKKINISIIAIITGILVFFIWVYIIPVDYLKSEQFYSEIELVPMYVSLPWILFRIIGASIIVPIAEELSFRGYIQKNLEVYFDRLLSGNFALEPKYSRLIKHMGTISALVSSSILFGILHSEILAGMIAGLCYGLIYLYRRRLIDAIIAHGITNLLLAVDVIYFGNWSYW